MKLKRFENDNLTENVNTYWSDVKQPISEENQKFDIIERLSQHWNEKLKNDFLVPRSLYQYTLKELKEIENFYLNENNCNFGCNYISKFVELHPEYDTEEFYEYVAANNKADRDIGELQDIDENEIERLSKEWKPLKESKPSIFNHTIYRLPTDAELEEVNSFNLNAKDIENGFGYTIIGRGMPSTENKQMIIDSIQMLIDKYPTNEEYKKALEIAKSSPIFNPKMVDALHELKQQHFENEAVEDIRIEGDEIVFDVKCETDIQAVTEYNGIQLRFNKLCSICEQATFSDEKTEDEIIAHAKMIKEQCINEYLNEIKINEDKNMNDVYMKNIENALSDLQMTLFQDPCFKNKDKYGEPDMTKISGEEYSIFRARIDSKVNQLEAMIWMMKK